MTFEKTPDISQYHFQEWQNNALYSDTIPNHAISGEVF
jgi:hypothetical protein